MNPSLPALQIADFIGPAVAAIIFIGLLSAMRDRTRTGLLVVMTAGFSTAYLGGGLGWWELAYLAPATYVAYRALNASSFIAVGWLTHSGWDLVHHFFGQPIWPWVPTSAIGCAIFDPIVGVWVLWMIKQGKIQPLAGLSARAAMSAPR